MTQLDIKQALLKSYRTQLLYIRLVLVLVLAVLSFIFPVILTYVVVSSLYVFIVRIFSYFN